MRTDRCSDGVLEPTGPAIASRVSASGEGSASRGATSLRLPLERGRGVFPSPSPVDRMKHASENITFPSGR